MWIKSWFLAVPQCTFYTALCTLPCIGIMCQSQRLCIYCIEFNIIFVLPSMVAKKERVFVPMCYATYIVVNFVATY